MKTRILCSTMLLAAIVVPAHAVTLPRRANVYGNAVDGKCTIEVDVDGAADVEIFGDQGQLRTLAGQTAIWRRFECNGVMPRNPADFRFVGVDGRGRQTLVRDPRQNGGRAVVRIEDRQGGREGYTFDVEWRGGGGGWGVGSGPGGPPSNQSGSGGPDRDRQYGSDRYGERGPGGPRRAIRVCQSSVIERLERDGFSYVTFFETDVDNNPGRNDWIIGTVEAKRGYRTNRFSFSCSVDFERGVVRSVDVRRGR